MESIVTAFRVSSISGTEPRDPVDAILGYEGKGGCILELVVSHRGHEQVVAVTAQVRVGGAGART